MDERIGDKGGKIFVTGNLGFGAAKATMGKLLNR